MILIGLGPLGTKNLARETRERIRENSRTKKSYNLKEPNSPSLGTT